MLKMEAIKDQVLHNCDIADAQHAGLYSICGLALRLRDLYKWEKGLAPWIEKDSTKILEWIEAKEDKWEDYPEDGFNELTIDGEKFDPFDTIGINAILEPHQMFYGAGYARSLKPTFLRKPDTPGPDHTGRSGTPTSARRRGGAGRPSIRPR